MNFANMLAYRYFQTENIDDLQAAISKTELALCSTPENHPNRAECLNNLGVLLKNQYLRTGNMDNLQAAISKAKLAVSTTPENHPDRGRRLDNLGMILSKKFLRTGNLDDLQAAIQKAELAVSITPENHPDKGSQLMNFADMLVYRYYQTGNIEDLQAAILKMELVLFSTPENHPDRVDWHFRLGISLSLRYLQTGNMQDLRAAISKAELAVSTTPEDHPNRAGGLGTLGSMILERFLRTGNIDDLQAAVQKAELAVSITSENHSERGKLLSKLANMLTYRYSRTGNVDDLQAAISKAELAVSTSPHDHLNRGAQFDSLGVMMSMLFTRTGNMEDLQAAISEAELAVSTTPENHSDRGRYLDNLGMILLQRFRRTGNIDDLRAAIQKAELADSITAENHPNRRSKQRNFANMLAYRYLQTRNIDDLEAAISKTEMSLFYTPENRHDRAECLHNLGTYLVYRYLQTGTMEALQAALSKMELAVAISPEDHLNRSRLLGHLGTSLFIRYSCIGDTNDLQRARRYLIDSFESPNSIPLTRVQSARKALQILISTKEWDQACTLAQAAIKLLPFICSRSLSRADQQYAILQISGLASDACSLSLKMGHVQQGLLQLEFGRGVILSYLIDSRSGLTKLQDDHPNLAKEYDSLSFKAYTDIEENGSFIRKQFLRDRQEAAIRLEECLHRIRLKTGYERFLLEPTVDELQQSASEGPIVIVNATDIGCDAIIVSTSTVQAIALPEMNSSQAPFFFQRRVGRHRSIQQWELFFRDVEDDAGGVDFNEMSWLWFCCVKPILSELKIIQAPDSIKLPRVWWIGTGIASSLPFHAAGQYNKESESYQETENTLSQIIPSYTPTIKALSYARLCASRTATINKKKLSILIVTMPATPGHAFLPGVNNEKLAIEQITKDFCTIEVSESPTVEHVLEKMTEFDITHFACHGSADPEDPSNSHLLLQKSGPSQSVVDRLTVSQISKRNTFGKTWIAFLSACSTAGVETKLLADECLHLASGFQVAGFAHVIGSLWRADDHTCALLAAACYRSLTKFGTKLSNRAVAEALRNAVLEIRANSPDPELWAPFIHSGA